MHYLEATDLEQHTGAVVAELRHGERFVLTDRGQPIAVIVPTTQQQLDEFLKQDPQADTLGWLKLSESAFAFWDNPEDAIWDTVEGQPLSSSDP
jgi:prevent-host-death family protein